jgi:hypothetical protein
MNKNLNNFKSKKIISPKSYLVLRMGKHYKLDPIAEVDKMIENFGYSWFAKFGKKILVSKVEDMIEKSSSYLVIISLLNSEYISKTYKLLNISQKKPNKNEPYPNYYNEEQQLVGAWFKIKNSDHQVNMDELIVKSSLNKLSVVFSASMGSSFFCITKTR